MISLFCITGLRVKKSWFFVFHCFIVTIYSIFIWKLLYGHFGYRVGTKSIFYREIRKGSIEMGNGMHLWKWEGTQNVNVGKNGILCREKGARKSYKGNPVQYGWAWGVRKWGGGSERWSCKEGKSQIMEGNWHGSINLNINFMSTFLMFCFIDMRLEKISQSHLFIRKEL